MSGVAPEPLYLDHAASTPPAEEVVEAMLPWLRGQHANPHSEHWHGQRAAAAVEQARWGVAALIGAQGHQIIFTSGATEANNLALKGIVSPQGTRRRLWLSQIEHKSLREPARVLAEAGVTVTSLEVNVRGRIDRRAFADAMEGTSATPGLVAMSHGNNEIGTINLPAVYLPYVHGNGHLLHLDASQSAAWEHIDVSLASVDLLCLSSHKLYGPGGIGALYIADAARGQLRPQLHGGGQEGNLRSGTVPTFLAVGFGVAAQLVLVRRENDRRHVQSVTEAFQARLREAGVGFQLVGDLESRLPGHLSIRFPGIEAGDLLSVLGRVFSASTGSACSAGELRASPVLRALGMDEETAGEVIRLSFGRGTSMEQGLVAAEQLVQSVARIRARAT